MKYAVLVGDGMGDYPLEELDNRTPLEVARTPNMDFIAKEGKAGIAKTIPAGFAPASDVANLSILGYEPKKYYSGRGPLEAANMGIALSEGEVAFRCNIVTTDKDTMIDYSAGHITTKEADQLIRHLDKELGSEEIKFYPGVSYRHLMVIKDTSKAKGLLKTKCLPPHDITGWKVSKHLPKGPEASFLQDLMNKSQEILLSHDVNKVRIDLGENPANMIWLWGQGMPCKMPKFSEKFGVEGSIISAVDLVKGIGKLIGLKSIDVPGATGYYDTNYFGKADYALKSLEDKDFVFVHVEAPDEAGHNGDLRPKITAIENFDTSIVGVILNQLKGKEDFRILVLPDHYTPIKLRTHTADPIFFAMYGKGIKKNEISAFNEKSIKGSTFTFKSGSELMEYFIKQ